tara:strand:+ start:842 stop:3190 length:2349 start_codon:yes stop_codon:yes gene_type:complete
MGKKSATALSSKSDFSDINTTVQFVEHFFNHNDYNSIFCIHDKPMQDGIGWPPLSREEFYAKLPSLQEGNSGSFYVSTMLVEKESEINNRQASFSALQMIVLDDIGTKGVDLDDLELPPTYVIETSEGNYQAGYVFDQPLKDLAKAKQLVTKVYGLGVADGGGALVNKYVRLPWGINNKIRDQGLDSHACRLVELNISRRPSIDEVAQAFGVEFKTATEDAYGVLECTDSVVPALQRAGLIKGTKDEGILMHCPWSNEHTSGQDDLATYYPIGTYDYPNQRGFNCFHDHCSHRTGDDVAVWLRRERATPDRSVVVSGELEYLLQTCVQEQANNMVHQYSFEDKKFFQADPLGNFLAQNARMIDTGEVRGVRDPQPVYKALGKAWQEHRRKKTVVKTSYAPGQSMFFRDGGETLNEYQPAIHNHQQSVPKTYLEHIDYLLPNDEDKELFHDWIAFKLQQPAKRSYMYLMIAPGASFSDVEEATSFGIGRSVVGSVLQHVFQNGVTYLTYDTLVGKNHDWGDWREKSQLIIVNEIKDESSSFRDGIKAYEKIKDAIDIYPASVTINPKHMRLKQIMQYFNVLGFSNHIDAIRLPEDDRRVYVAVNPVIKRSHSEYAEMHRLASGIDEQAIADIYWWYINRDISEFDHATPPESTQKRFMHVATETDVEGVIKALLDEFPGDAVHKHQLKMMSDSLWKDECNALDGLEYKILQREVNRLWKRLPVMSTIDKNHGGRVEGKAVRIIRNTKKWQDKQPAAKANDLIREQLGKNEQACAKAMAPDKLS